MLAREEIIPAGTDRDVEFITTYNSTWSVVLKRGTDVLAVEVASATMLLKKQLNLADDAAVVEKTTDDGIAVADGTLTATLTPEDTKDLNGKYFATLRIILTSGKVLDWQDSEYDNIPYVVLNFMQGAVEATS